MACLVCRTWNSDGRTCIQVRCLACGVEQCHSRGHMRGTCAHCHYGMIPGWSGCNNPPREEGSSVGMYPDAASKTSIRCVYKGCTEMAVYRHLPGSKKTCCKAHGAAILERRKRG